MKNVLPKIQAFRFDIVRALTAAAFLLLCGSAYLFRPAPTIDLLDEACSFLVAGGLTLWIALYLRWTKRPNTSTAITRPIPVVRLYTASWRDVLCFVFGSLAFFTLIEINSRVFGILALYDASSTSQFILFVTGLMLITLAFAGPLFPKNWHLWPQYSALSTQHFFFLILIIILAFALRVYHLGSAVHHFIDEIHFSNAVMSIRPADSTVKLLWPINTITAFPWLFSYMQAWGVDLLGRNLEGLRAISVVAGTLGIPALYFLGRELFDRRTALLAALLLAVFPPHIQFSRIGLNNIVDPLFGTLALAFLIRGLKYNRRVDFALGGAALGLTQYFYEGGRLLFPALILLTLAWFILVKPHFTVEAGADDNAKSSPRNIYPHITRRSSLFTFFLTAILIALPVYTTLLATNQPLDARFQTVGIGGSYWIRVNQLGEPQTLEEHILMPFLVYVYQPEIALYYGGEQAMLLPYIVPFTLLGVFVLLAYWRKPGMVIVVWVLLASLGNIIMTESAVYARYVVAFPALALLTAVGIRTLFALIWPRKSRWRRGVMIGLLSVLAMGQVTYFFGPHLKRYNEQLRQNFDSEDAIFRSAAFPSGTQIHVLTVNHGGQAYLSGIANYLADGLSVFALPAADVTAEHVAALSKSVDQAFFVEPLDTFTVNMLAQHFTLEGPFTSPYNVPPDRQLVLYYARASKSAG